MIRLLIVDNARLIGDALAVALKEKPDILVIDVATQVEEALSRLEQSDVVLAGASLPDGGAVRLIRAAARVDSPVKVVVTGADEDSVLEFLEAGAVGYVLKQESIEDLVQRVRATCDGMALLSPRIAAAVMARLTQLAHLTSETPAALGAQVTAVWPARAAAAPVTNVRLTAREQQVLSLLGQGLSNQEISDSLAIEIGTVKNHVHSILRKLKVNSRYQAVLSMAPATQGFAPAIEGPMLRVSDIAYMRSD